MPIPTSSLAEDFSSFLGNKEFSDLEFFVGDKVFNVHKSILAARSPVFQAMLKADMVERQNNRISIDDMSSDAAHEMLQFIYADKVSPDKLAKFAVELLAAADKVCVVLITSIHNLSFILLPTV